jgi:hypothetical protein
LGINVQTLRATRSPDSRAIIRDGLLCLFSSPWGRTISFLATWITPGGVAALALPLARASPSYPYSQLFSIMEIEFPPTVSLLSEIFNIQVALTRREAGLCPQQPPGIAAPQDLLHEWQLFLHPLPRTGPQLHLSGGVLPLHFFPAHGHNITNPRDMNSRERRRPHSGHAGRARDAYIAAAHIASGRRPRFR